MLDDEIIDKLIERLVNRIEQGNEYILKEIGKSVKQIGTLSPSKARQLAQILKYGGNYEKIVNKLAEITNLNVKEIYEIFDEVAEKNYQFAKQFYDYRGIKYIPYEENEILRRQVRALANITAQEYINLTNTTMLGFGYQDEFGNIVLNGLKEEYYNIIDEAVINISQGKTTFDTEMYRSLKKIGNSGVRIIYPTTYTDKYGNTKNRSMRLDSAVRMNLKGALRDLSRETSRIFGEEYGADGVEISVHINPAPDHAPIQGHQFTLAEYDKMQSGMDFYDTKYKFYKGIERGIHEWNCYHYEFNIVIGISKPLYTQEQLNKINTENEKGFTYEGKHYTNYEGTQLQRKLELEIRKQKDTQILARASDNKNLIIKSQQKITELTQKYKELSNISGLKTRMDRMRVSGFRRVKVDN